MSLVAVRSATLVVAAVGGAISWTYRGVEVLAWVALIAFVVALAVEVLIYALVPDKAWYEGRAAAESIKTLSWRYAVGGEPFSVELESLEAKRRFLNQIDSVTRDLSLIPPPVEASSKEITDYMDDARYSPFSARQELYKAGRIDDQITWYSLKARKNESKRLGFLVATIAIEFLGVLAAALRVAGVINFDLLGIVAAVVAGIATWAQTRQYGQLATSYAIAAHELNSIRTELDLIPEEGWPRFVDEAEEAISREHTLWRASRGVLAQRRRH